MRQSEWKIYVYAAFFLAIGILLQSIRLLVPMIPGPVNMFLIGSLVNMTLLLAVLCTKNRWLASIGLLLPIVAFVQGNLPLVFLVPIVGIGNVIYALLGYSLWQSKFVWLAALIKPAFLTAGTLFALSLFALPPQAAAALSFMMSWPQAVTGCLGIVLAKFMLQRLPGRGR